VDEEDGGGQRRDEVATIDRDKVWFRLRPARLREDGRQAARSAGGAGSAAGKRRLAGALDLEEPNSAVRTDTGPDAQNSTTPDRDGRNDARHRKAGLCSGRPELPADM
jgi:hypothetical protein